MKQDFRGDCPVTTALDVLGDKWMLVIVKQMLLEGKQTFKGFLESDEAIATNILSSKLKTLEKSGLVIKKSHPTNKKTKLYHLTASGLALTPVIVELVLWSDKHLRVFNPIMQQTEALESMKSDKGAMTAFLIANYKSLSAAVESD